MSFESILFMDNQSMASHNNLEAPDYFPDLYLDQVIESITAPKKEYDLKPFFYAVLQDSHSIHYRQSVFRDLENPSVFDMVNRFAEKMVIVRRYLEMIKHLYYQYHKEGWYLEAAAVYCEALSCFSRELSTVDLQSRGLSDFREYLNALTHSDQLNTLTADVDALKAELASIQYSIILRSNYIKIQKYEGEIDYSREVEQVFSKFKQGEVKDYKIVLPARSGMDHVEAGILSGVVKLFPEIFRELDQFCAKHDGFLDQTISRFDREIQFYIAYLEFISKIKELGLKFSYPKILEKEKNIQASAAFDIALANKYFLGDSPIVCNDFSLNGNERILVVTGPNQGGKTTFARMIGQLHYFACLGCPVSARKAKLFLFDRIFTHFEKEEDIRSLRGKLKDDLVRIHQSLKEATPRSIFIINEIFTSTTLKDAVFLGKQIMEEITRLESLCVCVTFIDELSSLGEQTVSMMSMVLPADPTVRTFKIERKPADGLSYAICIAEKHKLTYARIKDRIKNES